MKTTDLVVKPMTLSIIKAKKSNDTFVKITGLIPVKPNENTIFSSANNGEIKFTTFELFDNVDCLVGIQDVIERFNKCDSIVFNGLWVNGSFNAVSVKVNK